MEQRKDVTVPMEKDLVDDIDDELTYGDSRSEWVRNAIREKLARDAAEGDSAESDTDGGEAVSSA